MGRRNPINETDNILILTFPESVSKNLKSNLRMVDLPVNYKQFMH